MSILFIFLVTASIIMIFYQLLAIYGLYFLLFESSLFARPRFWLAEKSSLFVKLLGCSFCCGIWSTAAYYGVMQLPYGWVVKMLLAGGAFVYALHRLMERQEDAE